ncbi:MAG: EpsI family protein [Gemmataceae bacterium]|nr:EpsI family protein [Gemmataceae bacterium]
MKYTAIYIAALLMTAVGAGAHGYVTGRWRPHDAPAAATLPFIPDTSGHWRSEPLPSGIVDEGTLANITRKYISTKTGRILTVSLTCGPAGLVAQHTPEYCYPGSGFQAVGTTQTYTASPKADFRTAVYRKPAADALRIFWAWSADGNWTSPKVPELTFLRGSLHKLYVVSWDADRPMADDAELREFMTLLTATLNTALFPTDATAEHRQSP